jgi:hypothetical protein
MKGLAVLSLMLSIAACAVNEEQDVAPAESPAPVEAEPTKLEPTPSLLPSPQACAPGPSCDVIGTSCSTEGARRRCYLANYCEWLILQCQNGVWEWIG